jgi:hypothetical protein
MQKYLVTIVSGNEYTVAVLANNAQEARAFAYDLDLDDLTESDDCAHVVTECEVIENTDPVKITEGN